MVVEKNWRRGVCYEHRRERKHIHLRNGNKISYNTTSGIKTVLSFIYSTGQTKNDRKERKKRIILECKFKVFRIVSLCVLIKYCEMESLQRLM